MAALGPHIIRPERDGGDGAGEEVGEDAYTFSPEIMEYIGNLAAAGMPEREVMRAGFYVDRYGMEALSSGSGCVFFDEPDCAEGWNCLNPEHQVVVRE